MALLLLLLLVVTTASALQQRTEDATCRPGINGQNIPAGVAFTYGFTFHTYSPATSVSRRGKGVVPQQGGARGSSEALAPPA